MTIPTLNTEADKLAYWLGQIDSAVAKARADNARTSPEMKAAIARWNDADDCDASDDYDGGRFDFVTSRGLRSAAA